MNLFQPMSFLWSCCFLASVVASLSVNSTQQSLQLVQVLFRHGDRTPIDPYPKDAYKDYWPEGYGYLTGSGVAVEAIWQSIAHVPKRAYVQWLATTPHQPSHPPFSTGKQQHLDLGKYFRQRYQNFLNISYNRDEVLVNSTNVDRTLMSASSNLAGLYPPNGNQIWDPQLLWQPIPIHTVPTAVDYMLDTDSKCPKYEEEYDKVLVSPEMQEINRENRDLYKLISEQTGRVVSNIFGVNNIYDTIMIETLYNLSQPSWVAPVYGQMQNLSAMSFTYDFITDEERRLRAGPLLGHMIKMMQLKVNGTDAKRQLYMYSSHDTTVAAFLSGLNVFNGIAPPYACSVLVELHTMPEGGYGVQILYRNSTTVDPNVLTIANCTSLCPLDDFIELTRNVIPTNIVKECGVNPETFSSLQWTVTSVLLLILIIIVALGAVAFLIIRRRQNLKYQYTRVENH